MRKAVLFVDESDNCRTIKEMLQKEGISFVEYRMDEGCCGFTIEEPAIFAPEGIFRGIEGTKRYIEIMKNRDNSKESESAYW